MALVERIMGAPFEPDPTRKIVVHEFAACAYEVAFGPRTVAQIKGYYAMTPEEGAEFDKLVAQVTGTDAQRHRIVFQFEQIFILSEMRAPFYETPAAVRSRLGI